jgi:hypothetical protein
VRFTVLLLVVALPRLMVILPEGLTVSTNQLASAGVVSGFPYEAKLLTLKR